MKVYIQLGPVPVTMVSAIATAVTEQGYTMETPLFAGVMTQGTESPPVEVRILTIGPYSKAQVQTIPMYFIMVSREVEKVTDIKVPDLSALGLTMKEKP